MECPFELPVSKSQMPKNTKGITLYRIDKVYFPYTEEEADYIVQAINSHEKLVESIKYALGCGIMTETVCKKFEQALEAEKKE